MGLASIQSQVKSLEHQLQIIKAKLRKEEQKFSAKSFGDLYGLLKNKLYDMTRRMGMPINIFFVQMASSKNSAWACQIIIWP